MNGFPDLPAIAWLVISLLALGVVTATLRTLGNAALAATESHDLRVQVTKLQFAYRRRLLELNGGNEGTTEDPIEGVPVEELESEDVMLA